MLPNSSAPPQILQVVNDEVQPAKRDNRLGHGRSGDARGGGHQEIRFRPSRVCSIRWIYAGSICFVGSRRGVILTWSSERAMKFFIRDLFLAAG